MKFIIKLFPEIVMKSSSVRKRFIQVLSNNIRAILKAQDKTIAVVRHWDFIEVRSKDVTKYTWILDNLQRISGIHHILEVQESTFVDMHDIFKQTKTVVADKLPNKSFCVRVKRRGEHDFNSMELASYVGGGLNQYVATAKVQLKNPDIVVNIEIEDDKMMLVKARYEGMGGFPMSTQEDVLSLISGGFDSAVASFALMRRGSRVHYLFFNLGGAAHEIGVQKMAYHLWQRHSISHKVKFISVDFSAVVGEILTKVDDGYMGVVLKRMMMRAGSHIAKKLKINALITGEALGQVASQTLTNLAMIDKASETLVLRPLIGYDKQTIIASAEQIGVADIAKSMPEFCGVISKSPTVKAVEDKLIATETHFDFDILDKAVNSASFIDIRELKSGKNVCDIEITTQITTNDIVLDIRTVDETEVSPLKLANSQIMTMPFYQLGSRFGTLDQGKTYLLYCHRGVMSRLQAASLKDKGFDNVKVLQLVP